MSQTTYLVVGASRGIGKSLVEQLSLDSQNRVFATTRQPTDFKKANVQNLVFDQNDSELVTAAAAQVDRLDVLIVNAAIGDLEHLLSTSTERLQQYVETNIVGVHRVVNAFVPALRAGREKKIFIMSSFSASFQMQKGATFGFQGPYSVTKAANNMQVVQYHNELHKEGFTVVALHPGWVATDMGNIARSPSVKFEPIPVEESSAAIVKRIQELGYEQSCSFISYDGKTMPW